MNEDADKKAREQAEKANTIDSLIFQTEKQLKEVGDKLPADKKTEIESALAALKTAKESNNFDEMDKAAEKLNAVWQAASEDIYKATQANGQPNAEPGADTNATASGDNVQDVQYEEVKDDKN